MRRLDAARTLAVILALLGTGCRGFTDIDVPLHQVAGSGVAGTAHLSNAFCKSYCALVSVDLSGPSTRELVTDLRRGRCAALGVVVQTFQFPCGDVTPCQDQLYSTSDVRTLRGDHAIAVSRFDPVEQVSTVVACGEI